MKGIIVAAILITLGVIFGAFKKNGDWKKLFFSLGTFGFILSIAFMGFITRQIMPIFIGHIVLTILAWGSLFLYIFRGKYHWYIIVSPLITIGLFLVLEYFTGSGSANAVVS